MLNTLCNASLIRLNVKADDWQSAIREAMRPLVENQKVMPGYVDEIIRGVIETGPYIVITKHVALPHARPEYGALETAIGVTTLLQPIPFGNKANDPVKYLFCLSATDNTLHLEALAQLAGLLEQSEFFALLDHARDPQEVMDFLKEIR